MVKMKFHFKIMILVVVGFSQIALGAAAKIEDLSEQDRQTFMKIRSERNRQRILEDLGKLKEKQQGKQKERDDYRLREKMKSTFWTWANSDWPPHGLDCDAAIREFIESGPSEPRSYFLAAQIAFLRNQYDMAISILETGIAKDPDAASPVGQLSVATAGRLWKGTIQRYAGDTAKAIETYDKLKTSLDPNRPEDVLVSAMCSLYLWELANTPKGGCMCRFQDLEDIIATKPLSVLGTNDPLPLYRQWATFFYVRDTQGEKLASVVVPPSEPTVLLAIGHLTVNGLHPAVLDPSGPQLHVLEKRLAKRIFELPGNGIDKELYRMMLGYLRVTEQNDSGAEEHFTALYQGQHFLSPLAGLLLAQTNRRMGKQAEAQAIIEQIKSQHPVYSTEIDKIKARRSK